MKDSNSSLESIIGNSLNLWLINNSRAMSCFTALVKNKSSYRFKWIFADLLVVQPDGKLGEPEKLEKLAENFDFKL